MPSRGSAFKFGLSEFAAPAFQPPKGSSPSHRLAQDLLGGQAYCLPDVVKKGGLESPPSKRNRELEGKSWSFDAPVQEVLRPLVQELLQ